MHPFFYTHTHKSLFLPATEGHTSEAVPAAAPHSALTFSLYTFISIIPFSQTSRLCPSTFSKAHPLPSKIILLLMPYLHHKSLLAGLLISQDKAAKEAQEPAPHAGKSPSARHITLACCHPSWFSTEQGNPSGCPSKIQGLEAHKHTSNQLP